jgi:hypothetical protein
MARPPSCGLTHNPQLEQNSTISAIVRSAEPALGERVVRVRVEGMRSAGRAGHEARPT